MIQIVNTNDTRLRLSQLNVGLFSTLSIALPQVPATATEVQIIITNGTIASAYNATLDTGDDCWKCDVNLGQFSSVGKQKYEVAYKIDGKQMWDGQGWIEILPATVSGITPQPTPPPTRYAAVSITVNGSDPVFADENGNIALTLPNYDGKLPFKPLPEYLHAIAMDDTYPADADAFYQSLVSAEIGGCSAVRIENRVGRNYDWKYDRAAEFVVKVSKIGSRHASVGIASLGSRLTENMVMSGEYQPLYRALAGMTLDGINDAGVVAEINVIPRDSAKDPVESSTRNIHALAVVRYALDNFATALEAAQYIAAHYYIPEGFTDSYHWSIYDINESYIVEDGEYHKVESGRPILTNHRVYSTDLYGSGYSRDAILSDASTITEALSSVKFTNAYAEGFPWTDEFAGQIDGQGEIPYTATERLRAWATEHITPLLNEERKPAERGNGCWQTVHSTIYDLENKTLAVCVQEDFTKRFIFAAGGSVSLDDTVTEDSENGVKSSGIWLFVNPTKTAVDKLKTDPAVKAVLESTAGEETTPVEYPSTTNNQGNFLGAFVQGFRYPALDGQTVNIVRFTTAFSGQQADVGEHYVQIYRLKQNGDESKWYDWELISSSKQAVITPTYNAQDESTWHSDIEVAPFLFSVDDKFLVLTSKYQSSISAFHRRFRVEGDLPDTNMNRLVSGYSQLNNSISYDYNFAPQIGFAIKTPNSAGIVATVNGEKPDLNGNVNVRPWKFNGVYVPESTSETIPLNGLLVLSALPNGEYTLEVGDVDYARVIIPDGINDITIKKDNTGFYEFGSSSVYPSISKYYRDGYPHSIELFKIGQNEYLVKGE